MPNFRFRGITYKSPTQHFIIKVAKPFIRGEWLHLEDSYLGALIDDLFETGAYEVPSKSQIVLDSFSQGLLDLVPDVQTLAAHAYGTNN